MPSSFLKWLYQFTLPPNNVHKFQVCLILTDLFILAILSGFNLLSLMIKDTVCLFICLGVIWVSFFFFFVKCLFKSFNHSLLGCLPFCVDLQAFFMCTICEHFSDVCVVNIFQFVVSLLSFWILLFLPVLLRYVTYSTCKIKSYIMIWLDNHHQMITTSLVNIYHLI